MVEMSTGTKIREGEEKTRVKESAVLGYTENSYKLQRMVVHTTEGHMETTSP